MPLMSSPERRLVLAVDMQRYSQRSNVDQYRVQQAYREVMREAAEHAGLSRDAWSIQQAGDGEVSILSAGTPESVVIAGLTTALDKLLRDHNHPYLPQARVRLRLALHTGPVHRDAANGYAGEPVVAAARLVNASPLKKALDEYPDAALALIVSDVIYRDVVRHRYDGIRPERFSEVHVSEKEFSDRAWIYIPDEDATKTHTGESQAPVERKDVARSSKTDSQPQSRHGASDTPSGSPTVQGNTFHGTTVFGSSGVTGRTINIQGDFGRGS